MPVAALDAHSDCVSSLVWQTANLLYTGGWDCRVKEWDVCGAAGATATTTLVAAAAVLCVDVSLAGATIASGHSDHRLRLWDARAGTAPTGALAHNAWVAGVAWAPNNAHQLLTACHDGSVRLWDVRSTIALHRLASHSTRALCVAWGDDDVLYSGGADGRLHCASLAEARA